MKLFHIRLNRFLPLSALPVGFNKPFIRIFMAKSHKDRPLRNVSLFEDYIYPLQVGAANTEIRIADISDEKGDNISKKNVNYSELTGLYWIWKNKLCLEESQDGNEGQYYGLAQFRRMLTFSNDDLLRLKDNDVDVILAKKKVLKDYCEWLFPILERMEELSVPKGCDRADRYIGYMGETLETLYFMKNVNNLTIVHTECKLYT